MFAFLRQLVKQGNFEGVGDAPNKQNPCIYRQAIGENPVKHGYAFGAYCGDYELTPSGQWLVDGEVRDRPLDSATSVANS